MLPMLVLAAAVGVPPCWDIFEGALRASALAPHPAYVTYDERMKITQDDVLLEESRAFVDYRDDGISRVRDERYSFVPDVTRQTEPGPPELGPYAGHRQSWIPQPDILPTIADVHVQGDITCNVADVETYKGHTTYRLVFDSPAKRPSLKALWVDTRTGTIWKLIVSGYLHFLDDPGAPPALADFQVEAGYQDGYLVVNHVVWSYERREYGQYSDYFGEYTMSGFTFPSSLPRSYFALAAPRE